MITWAILLTPRDYPCLLTNAFLMHFYKQSVKDLGFLVTGCFLCKVFCQPQRSAKYNLQAHCSVLKTMALKVSVKIFLKLSEDIVGTCHEDGGLPASQH